MKERDEQWLYKDLQYTTSLYIAGEQMYPYWETIYALLTGAFLTVYFTASSLGFVGRLLLCIIGLIYSINWRRLCERNRSYANSRERRMTMLCKLLQRNVDLDSPLAVAADNGTEPECMWSLTAFHISEDQRNYLTYHTTWWNRTSTWDLRIAVPRYIIWVWVFLVVYAIYKLCATLYPLPSWL